MVYHTEAEEDCQGAAAPENVMIHRGVAAPAGVSPHPGNLTRLRPAVHDLNHPLTPELYVQILPESPAKPGHPNRRGSPRTAPLPAAALQAQVRVHVSCRSYTMRTMLTRVFPAPHLKAGLIPNGCGNIFYLTKGR